MTLLMRGVALLLLLASVLLPCERSARAQSKPAPVLVIVGAATGIADISLALLRRAFQGDAAEYAWGKRLIPFNLEGGSEARTRFDRSVLGLEPDEVGRFWINRRIRDEGGAPRALASPELAIKVVASLRGAISYVGATPLPPSVRALTIDGKAPSQKGYVLGTP